MAVCISVCMSVSPPAKGGNERNVIISALIQDKCLKFMVKISLINEHLFYSNDFVRLCVGALLLMDVLVLVYARNDFVEAASGITFRVGWG